jgi:hypothetical protein
MIQNNLLFIPFESHAEGLVEYYGKIAANGTVIHGARGVTVSRLSAGRYLLSLVDQAPVYNADMANTDMSAKANGTGVTKTCVCDVTATSIGVASTSTTSHAISSEAILNTDGSISFNVATVVVPAAGGAGVLTDNIFFFKIVVSSMLKEIK